jgi:arylsulfatase A-like enzyme
VMRGPGIGRGARQEAFVNNALDLAATMWDVAGLPVPDGVQGRSLRPLLAGEAPADWRQEIVATYSGAQFGLYTQRMLRDTAWKYVWNPTDVDELYDLRVDPWELANRVDDPASAAPLADLRARLYRQLAAQGDALAGTAWMRGQLLDGKKLGTVAP